MDNKCVICGSEVPEGRMVCPMCERMSYPIFMELKNAVDFGYSRHWDSFRIVTLLGGGYCVEPVFPTGYKPVDKDRIGCATNMICADYCKYPEMYAERYDDVEEAQERLAIECCEDCPVTRIIMEECDDGK